MNAHPRLRKFISPPAGARGFTGRAAHRAFADLQRTFLRVLDAPDALDPHGVSLGRQVRLARTAEDLWRLRSPLFEVLRADAVNGARRQLLLRRGLEGVFPGRRGNRGCAGP